MSARRSNNPLPLKKSANYKTSPAGTGNASGKQLDCPRRLIVKLTKKQLRMLRVVFFVFLFLFWRIRYYDFLFMAQEYDLFVWRLDYLNEASIRIAGLSRFLASFLIQFFYYPTVGSLLLSSFALVSQYATEKIFQLNSWRGIVLSFIPACLSTLSVVNVHYYLFERIDVAYLFSFTFNFCFTLVFALIFHSIKSSLKRVLFLLFGYLFVYPVFGFFALLAAFLCVLEEWSRAHHLVETRNTTNVNADQLRKTKTSVQRQREKCELLVLYVLLIPGIFWLFYSKTTPTFHYMYTAGLWEESTLTQGREIVETNLASPFLILLQGKLISRDLTINSLLSFYTTSETLFLLILSVFNAFFNKYGSCRYERQIDHAQSTRQKLELTASILLISFCCVCTVLLSFSSANYQALLRITRALDYEDWEMILLEESKVDEPINPLISARNLSLFKTNRIAEELFKRPAQPKCSRSLQVIETACMGGDRILYEYGATNLSSRIAVNNLVLKRERSAWALKTLSLCAIADRRPELAKRFLFRLQGTLFHKRIATELLDYIASRFDVKIFDNYLLPPNKTTPKRIKELDQHFESIRQLKPHNDAFFTRGSVDQLVGSFIQSDDLSTRTTQELEKIIALLLFSRNYSRLNSLLDQYLKNKGKERIPRYLQEAILWIEAYPGLFDVDGFERWNSQEDLVIDQQIRDNFNNFTKDLSSLTDYGNDRITGSNRSRDDFIDSCLKIKYGDTFWFFFGASVKTPSY